MLRTVVATWRVSLVDKYFHIQLAGRSTLEASREQPKTSGAPAADLFIDATPAQVGVGQHPWGGGGVAGRVLP